MNVHNFVNLCVTGKRHKYVGHMEVDVRGNTIHGHTCNKCGNFWLSKYSHAQRMNHIKWLRQLRSPDANKANSMLEYTDYAGIVRRCCLGQACHALGITRSETKFKWSPIIEVAYGDQPDRLHLPAEAVIKLGINKTGTFIRPVAMGDGQWQDLTALNDMEEFTLKEIANVIEDCLVMGNFQPYDYEPQN